MTSETPLWMLKGYIYENLRVTKKGAKFRGFKTWDNGIEYYEYKRCLLIGR